MIALTGCRTQPLGSYLQGLGVWRAVCRLAEPGATACWRGGVLTLDTAMDADGLVALLRDRFEPLPVVSPWNKGSGFAANGKSKEAERALDAVRASDDPRFAELRGAVLAADRVVAAARAAGLDVTGDDKAAKARVIALCRAMLPDAALPWLDAAVVLGQDRNGADAVFYSRLLGTGGNFGRQDLQATYIQRTLTVLADRRAQSKVDGWLRDALFGGESTPYLREAVGQFDPGRAGGVQSSPAEAADKDGFANPWSFLFTVEGAVLFASAATRRQGATSSDAAVPFVVRPSPVGYGTGTGGEAAHAEVWTPEWDRPATLSEISALLAEGRATWNERTARTGLDLARAVATLGVDRGIRRFTRTLIADRFGQSPLAVPVATVDVGERPGAGLLRQLDRWLDQLRRGDPPAGVEAGVRRLEAAMYAAATDGGPRSIRDVLAATGRLHESVARSGAARDRVRPLVLTDPAAWWGAAGPQRSDELGSAEVRIAVALSSAADPGVDNPLRALLSPVTAGRSPAWTGRPPVVTGAGPLDVLAAAHRRRSLAGTAPDPAEDDAGDGPLPAVRGVLSAFRYAARRAGLADAAALATGRLASDVLADQLSGWLLMRWRPEDRAAVSASAAPPVLIPPVLALLLPFYGVGPLRVRHREDDPQDDSILLRPGADWLPRLLAGDTGRVLADAALRLRAEGLPGVVAARNPGRAVDPAGLVAALLLPLPDADRRRCLNAAYTAPPSIERTPA